MGGVKNDLKTNKDLFIAPITVYGGSFRDLDLSCPGAPPSIPGGALSGITTLSFQTQQKRRKRKLRAMWGVLWARPGSGTSPLIPLARIKGVQEEGSRSSEELTSLCHVPCSGSHLFIYNL